MFYSEPFFHNKKTVAGNTENVESNAAEVSSGLFQTAYQSRLVPFRFITKALTLTWSVLLLFPSARHLFKIRGNPTGPNPAERKAANFGWKAAVLSGSVQELRLFRYTQLSRFNAHRAVT